MRLSRKLVLPLSIAIFLVLAVAGFLSVRRERQLFGEDAQRDHRLVGTLLAEAAEREIWAEGGAFDGAERAIRGANLRDPELHAYFARLSEIADPEDLKRVLRGEPVDHLTWS